MSDILTCVSPVDESVLYERPIAEDIQVASALEAANRAQQSWRKTTLADREAVCLRMVESMLAMRDEIVPELAWQMGRPVRFGAGELAGFEERARHMIAIARDALAPLNRTTGPISRFIAREPVGVVLVIAPWNYPFLTAVNSVIPALMAGNAVIPKHAAQTLLVGDRFQAAADAGGVPDGLFRHLVMSHDQGARMIASGMVDQVNFTGSVGGGRAVSAVAGRALVGVGLELGGKDPAYVRGDADLAFAAENLADGAYFNSGQSCCGIERMYVHEDRFDAFTAFFAEITSAYVLGSPLDQPTTLGPMVTRKSADFVRRQVDAAIQAGAQPLLDGDDGGGCYLGAQALIDVDHTMSLMTDESFGPVVGIMPVSGDEEAITLMNDSRYGLTASIWTADVERAEVIGRGLRTGTVFANRCDYLDPSLAWTGVKESGRGATLSTVGYETLTRPKSFYLRPQP